MPLFCMSLGPVVMAALAATVRDTADAAMLRCLAALVLAVTALFWAALVQHSVSLSDHARAKNIGGIAIAYLCVSPDTRPSPTERKLNDYSTKSQYHLHHLISGNADVMMLPSLLML